MTNLQTAISAFVVHVLLTSLPVVAALLVAMALGVTDRLLLLCLGLSGLLVTGYLTFWIFWANPLVGHIFVWVLTPGLVVLVVWLGVPRRRQLRPVASSLRRPFFLWVASSVLIFSFGAMYPSSHVMTTTAESRFVPGLPIDNEVPLILAKALQSPHRPIAHPLYVVWDSSDRPPLQAGVYLSEQALVPGGDAQGVHYEVVGILLQGLWIFGLWGLLAAVRARARLVALVFTAVLFSGFVLVNTFFTWPKLYPAAYLVLLAAILLTPSFHRLRASMLAGATAGALAGAALLGHEGSGLAIVAYIIVMLIQRRKPSRRFVLAAVAVLVVSQGSWMLYQKVVDPPGDQLARLQIANQLRLPGDPRPLMTVIVATYEKTPFGTIVDNKLSNVETPFAAIPKYVWNSMRLVGGYLTWNSATRESAAANLIGVNFYYLVPSLGFLGLGFFAWAASAIRDRSRRTTPIVRLAGTIWLFFAVNLAVWAIVLFGPSATLIHQGSYVIELLALTACVIGLWDLWPRLCVAIVLFQASFTVVVYGLSGSPVPAHADAGMLALALVGLASTIVTLWFMWHATSTWTDWDLPDGRQWRQQAASKEEETGSLMTNRSPGGSGEIERARDSVDECSRIAVQGIRVTRTGPRISLAFGRPQ